MWVPGECLSQGMVSSIESYHGNLMNILERSINSRHGRYLDSFICEFVMSLWVMFIVTIDTKVI
jgi:hypothetical protein